MSEVLEEGVPPASPDERGRRRHLAPFVAVAVALVIGLFIVVAAVVKGGVKETADTPLLGQPAPVLQTTTVDGQPFDLAARRGSWVVLNFFSTWCRPCVAEHPALVRFAADQAASPDGAELVSVIFNDDVSDVERFFAEEGGDWPRLTDPDGKVQVAFGVAKSPETWIIDPSGIVRARVISQVTAEGLEDLLGRLQTGVGAGRMTRRASTSRWSWLVLGLVAAVALAVGVARTGGASTPEERLDAVAKTVKCPVCPGESVYESRNSVAINVKNEIARQIRAGRTDDQIRAGLAAKFGDSVLLVPRANGIDVLVWVLPVVVLIASAAGLVLAFRRWRRQAGEVGEPTAEDRARVEEALRRPWPPEPTA